MDTFFRPFRVFGIHNPIGLRIQLRVSISPLRSHKFRHNFDDTPSDICSCNQGIADTKHFLLFYPICREQP